MVEKLSYQPAYDGVNYKVEFDGKLCRVESADHDTLVANVEKMDDTLRLAINPFEQHKNPSQLLAVALDYLLGHQPEIQKVTVGATSDLLNHPYLKQFQRENSELVLSRGQFYQWPQAWQHKDAVQSDSVGSEIMITTDERPHPKRPQVQLGLQYKRYVPALGKTISFRTVDVEKDLDVFHHWHNQAYVYDLWDLNKPKDELKTYLEKGLKDPHQIPMMVEIDNEPVGYFEIYWIAEDRLGPYYDHKAYDRGFHFLIGNKNFLGRETTCAIVRSVMHMIYLDDYRTEQIAVEPRADNKKVIRYSLLVPGWRFVKEFDFPHKRAALLIADREAFFAGAL